MPSGNFCQVRCVWLKYFVVSNRLDLNKSPPDTDAKLKNQRTKNVQKLNKERQADVGFGSSLTNWCKRILSNYYELKIVKRYCYQRRELGEGWVIEFRPPGTAVE